MDEHNIMEQVKLFLAKVTIIQENFETNYRNVSKDDENFKN